MTRHQSTYPPWFFIAVLLAVVAVPGCDEVKLEENGGGAPTPLLQPGTLTSNMTLHGLASIFEVTHPEGFAVQGEPQPDKMVGGHEVALRGIDQKIDVSRVQASVKNDDLQLTVTSDTPSLTLTAKLTAPLQFCRFQIGAERLTIKETVTNIAPGNWRLRVAPKQSRNIDMFRLEIRSVNSCPRMTDENGDVISELRPLLVEHLERSVAAGMDDYVDISLFEEFGLLEGTHSLTRLSPFSNRRGAVRLVSNIPEEDGVTLNEDGLLANVNVGVSSKRAACAPPVDLDTPEDTPADPVTGEDLAADGKADAGLALAKPLMARLVQAATLGGFMCRGLDSRTLMGGDNISRHDARLGEIGLESLPISSPLEPVVSTGELPKLELRAANESIDLVWKNLTVELYGEVSGARVRLLTLETNVTFNLRPVSPASVSMSSLELDLETIEVTEGVTLRSPWKNGDQKAVGLKQWTQRLLHLVFEDSFSLPLPVAPSAPLDLVHTQVRENDLMLLFEIETP